MQRFLTQTGSPIEQTSPHTFAFPTISSQATSGVALTNANHRSSITHCPSDKLSKTNPSYTSLPSQAPFLAAFTFLLYSLGLLLWLNPFGWYPRFLMFFSSLPATAKFGFSFYHLQIDPHLNNSPRQFPTSSVNVIQLSNHHLLAEYSAFMRHGSY